MSSTRGSAGSPWTVTSRNVAFSLVEHFAVSSPGTLTHGVSIAAPEATHGLIVGVLVIVRPVASRYACSVPLPPPSAAGFTHAAVRFGSGTLPKSVFDGGGSVERNVE